MAKVGLIAFSMAVFSSFSLSGCATAAQTYLPDGRRGYTVECPGAANSWGKCYEKAGEICGAKGYDIVSQTGDKGGMVSGNQYGLYGGSVITRDLLIACKS